MPPSICRGRWRVGAMLALSVGWTLLSQAGCTRAPASEAAIDLLTLLPEAESWCETAEIDLGTAAPEPALLGGWGAPSRAVSDYL